MTSKFADNQEMSMRSNHQSIVVRAFSKPAGFTDDYRKPRGEMSFSSMAEWNGDVGLAWRLSILKDPAIAGHGHWIVFEIYRCGAFLRSEAL